MGASVPATRARRRWAEILEPASVGDRASRWFDHFIIGLILLNVLFVILSTVEEFRADFGRFFLAVEALSLAVFTAEYVARVWVAPELPGAEPGFAGRVKWMLTPLALIDLAAILPFYLFFLFPTVEGLRILRVFITLRLLKLGRYSESLQTFGRVARAKGRELLLTGVVLLVLLVFTSSAMYAVESEAQPEVFSSIPASMWWAIVTLTTVGYGDTYPVTTAGRVLGALIAIIGIGLFALPAGLLASGFADEVQKKREEKAAEVAAVAGAAAAAAAEHGPPCPHCGQAMPAAPGR